MYRLGYKSRS